MSYHSPPPPYVISLLHEVEDLRKEVNVVNEKLNLVLGLLRSDKDSIGSFELFEEEPHYVRDCAQATASSAAQNPVPSASSGEVQSWEEREKICKGIGKYLNRALAGQHRGSSGRDKIKLASRLYIIVKEFVGNVHVSPVRVVYRFSEAKQLCSQGGDWGGAVFVGVDEAEDEEPTLRDRLVLKGTVSDTHYEVGQIELPAGTFSAIIAVGEAADVKILVCVPFEVWSKRVVSRLLPIKALGKPIAYSLEACDEESRELLPDGRTIKVWMGILSTELEEAVVFTRVEPPDHAFGVGDESKPLVPSARALAEVLSERFAFQSAAESQERDQQRRAGEGDRLDAIEASLLSLKENLAPILGASREEPRKPALQPGGCGGLGRGRE
eukprot:s2486_g4.t1